MEYAFTQIELLDDFARKVLSPEEQADFEKKIRTDPDFRNEYDVFQQLLEGINAAGDQELRNQITVHHLLSKDNGLLHSEEDMMAYLDGSLPDEQAGRLEKRLQTDPDFAREMAQRTAMLEAIRLHGDLQLRKNISQAHQKLKADGHLELAATTAKIVQMQPRSRAFQYAIAASLTFLLAVGLWWSFAPSKYDRAFSAHFSTEKESLASVLDELEHQGFVAPNSPAREALINALSVFEKGDIPQAAELLKAYAAQFGPDNPDARFFLGIALLSGGKFGEAAFILQPLANDSASPRFDGARFYLALAWCKIPARRQEALHLLLRISEDGETGYREKANNLIRDLK